MERSNTHLDATDAAIIAELQRDATTPNNKVARRVGLSPSACLARTKRLRASGAIRSCTAVVDERAAGLETIAFVFVDLSPHSRKAAESFVKKIRAMDHVLECYNITGHWDYLLKIVAPDIQTYRDYLIDRLIAIPGVTKVETLVVLGTEKRALELPLEHLLAHSGRTT